MRTTIVRGMVVAMVGLGLAACSNSSSPAASSSSSTPSATPATPAKTATTAQYASVVAATANRLRADLAKYSASHCKVGYAIGFRDNVEEVTCLAHVDGIGAEAQAVKTDLTAAQSGRDPAYIGPPPNEVRALVAATASSAEALGSKAKVIDSCGKQCAVAGRDFDLAVSDMASQLDAWKPYGA